jgi:membrane protease YdiL (CAAX protease family)
MSSVQPGMPVPPVPPAHPAPPEHPELPAGIEPKVLARRWRAWTAWVALIAGFAAAIVGALVIGLGSAAFGASLDDPPPSVNILATVVQNACLVVAAILLARLSGRTTPWDFGLKPAPFWRSVGWALLVWLGFILVTAGWVALIGASDASDELPQELGVDESTVALVAVAFLVCVVAPVGEEFFFRGYFFQALSSWKGVWPAAVITGVIFGAIHGGSSDPAFLVPLGVFGFGLCVLLLKTGSLYPCIFLHAVNNCTAFGASQDWDWQILPLIAGAFAVIALLLWVVRLIAGPAPSSARLALARPAA